MSFCFIFCMFSNSLFTLAIVLNRSQLRTSIKIHTTYEARIVKLHQTNTNTTPLWFEVRKGRVPASHLYAGHTCEDNQEKSQDTCDSLIKRLLFPTSLVNISHVQRWAKLESISSIKPASSKRAGMRMFHSGLAVCT